MLCDEGWAYAAKLRAAGVPVTAVRYLGIIHDFVMLDALRPTHAATAAIAQGCGPWRTPSADPDGEALQAVGEVGPDAHWFAVGLELWQHWQ